MNVLATSLLLSLGLSVASAGQPNPRFYGIWVGVETYEIPAHGGPHARQGEPPVKKSVVIEVGDSGQTLAFGQGLLLSSTGEEALINYFNAETPASGWLHRRVRCHFGLCNAATPSFGR
jgi:hypothetical protein